MLSRACLSLSCLLGLLWLPLTAAETAPAEEGSEPVAAEDAAAAEEPADTEESSSAAAPPAAVPPDTFEPLANELAEVVISERRGAIAEFHLLHSHPIPIPTFRGGEGSDTNTKRPLSVLGSFKSAEEDPSFGAFRTEMHNYLLGMGLGPEGRWTPNDDESVEGQRLVLEQTSPDEPLRYTLVYEMHPVRPTVQVSFTVEHTGGEPVDIQPRLIAVNGIHQDDPKNEDYDMRVVASFDGEEDPEFDKWGLPGHGQVKKITHPGLDSDAVPASRLNYVGLKSRFFTAFWSPGTLEIIGADEVAEESAAPDLDAASAGAEGGGSGGFRIDITAKGYHQQIIAGEYAKQAWIHLHFLPEDGGSEFRLAEGQVLRMTWSITAAGMTDDYLDTLTSAEARIEYTDGFYNFFKLLVRMIAPILDLIVLVVQSYGVAVIVFVIVIKALLHRLNVKQHRGLARMSEIAPKMQALKERYKHDPQTLQRKMFELYREEKFNPLAGCLPMLIQMPIFFAVFQTFRHYAPMRESGFLWISDLTMPDQIFPLFSIGSFLLTINPLPLLYIAFWIWAGMSQKIPENAPDQQRQMAKIMRWLPVVFGIFLYNFPAGLMLYMLVSSVIGNLEMRYLRKKYGITGTALPA